MFDAAAQALLCAVLFLLFRWAMHRTDSLGRPDRFPGVALVLLLVPMLALGAPGLQRRVEQHRLGSAASQLIGQHVSVHCQTMGQAFVDLGNELGYVKWGRGGVPEHRTLIKHDQCGYLRSYLRSSKSRPSLDQVVAVHVLTHEDMHMSGITTESLAECAAVQRDARMAELLGASPSEAIQLARTYWREVYPQLSPDYVNPSCGPGGPLDEHLADAPWS
jgi:hypothetical protein